MERFKRTYELLMSFLTIIIFTSCNTSNNNSKPAENKTEAGSSAANVVQQKIPGYYTNSVNTSYKVTFIELGSVRCIPCQQMQPVMKSIGQKFGKQVKVVFHDVWTEAGAPYAKKYGVEAIPTQVFLDETGKEFYRHIGFFPEEELIKILNQKGVW